MQILIKDKGLMIAHMPHRARPSLMVKVGPGNIWQTVASFKGLASSELFKDKLVEMFKEAGVRVDERSEDK